jgi:hypothetical protein
MIISILIVTPLMLLETKTWHDIICMIHLECILVGSRKI